MSDPSPPGARPETAEAANPRQAGDSPKSRRTRARILDTAVRLFAETGYHPAANPLIAEAAGLTRGAMLYHFATREQLVEAAITHLALYAGFPRAVEAMRTTREVLSQQGS